MSHCVERYLERFAEPEAHLLIQSGLRVHASHFVAVPLCAESPFLPDLIQSIHGLNVGVTESVLMTCVINNRKSADEDIMADNLATIEWFHQNFKKMETISEHPHTWLGESGSLRVIVIERIGAYAFDDHQGVGLARKIGADIGLALFSLGFIDSHYLHNTDGDVTLPSDYFDQVKSYSRDACLIYRFRHVRGNADRLLWNALKSYDMWLRYYRIHLCWAGSPYGFHSIGSLMAVNFESYAQVRGFPKRKAAEDFYLLNKLAKVGSCTHLSGGEIFIRCRQSLRVPFGTGRGTMNALELARKGLELQALAPEVFVILGLLLKAIEETLQGQYSDPIAERFAQYPEWVGKLIESWNFDQEVLAAQKRSRSLVGSLRQFHCWFDGFKTMKFLHHLRDHGFDSIRVSEGVRQMLLNIDLNSTEISEDLFLRVCDYDEKTSHRDLFSTLS